MNQMQNDGTRSTRNEPRRDGMGHEPFNSVHQLLRSNGQLGSVHCPHDQVNYISLFSPLHLLFPFPSILMLIIACHATPPNGEAKPCLIVADLPYRESSPSFFTAILTNGRHACILRAMGWCIGGLEIFFTISSQWRPSLSDRGVQ